MIAYKGFTKELWSNFGDGNKNNCQFKIGETKRVEESKTARSGFHCCENPFECLAYYPLDGQNRFFKVMAAGDIDEDENERVACTEITLIHELSQIDMAVEGMIYMIEHPQRKKWEQSYIGVQVKKNRAEAAKKGHIAIARGKKPRVKGPEGSILGMIIEKNGRIEDAKILVADGKQADKWLTLTSKRQVKIIEESKD